MATLTHPWGGLMNISRSQHVNSAIQALLRVEHVVDVVKGDTNHQKLCRSLLSCMPCALRRLMEGIEKKGSGDPSFFVRKWKDLSSEMNAEKQGEAYEVLFIFINRLRLEFVQRNPSYTIVEIRSSPVNVAFESVKSTQVICPICGTSTHDYLLLSVELLSTFGDSLHESLLKYFWDPQKNDCKECRRMVATEETVHVKFAPYLIVHCYQWDRSHQLPLSMKLKDVELSLISLISQELPSNSLLGSQCIFIAKSEDGSYKQFKDTWISNIAPSKLMLGEFLKTSKVTIVYKTNLRMPTQPISNFLQVKGNEKRIPRFKVVSFPKLNVCDSTIDLVDTPDLPSHRSVGTQTCNPQTTFAHAGIQTEKTEERFVSFEKCKSLAKFKFFTGLSVDDYYSLFNLIGGEEVIRTLKMNYNADTPKKLRDMKISCEDRLFMFLLRLRRGLPLEELAFAFNVSVSLVGEICYVMTRHIYLTFKEMETKMFPTAALQMIKKPKVMKPFKSLRVILDGASFFIQQPSNFEQQGNNYSSYKSHTVLLVVLGISCQGATVFCSEAFEGSISDKQAVLKSNLLSYLQKGDGVMTDRGFELTGELQKIGCYFYKPPSLGDRECLTPEEEILTKALAAARIYSEHAIAEMKDNRLLQGVIPLTLLPVISDLVYIAAYLRNFNPSRIRNIRVVVNEESESDSSSSG